MPKPVRHLTRLRGGAKIAWDLDLPRPSDANYAVLLKRIKQLPHKPPVQAELHKQLPVNLPGAVDTAMHAYVRKGKTDPLGPRYEGPFPITECCGKSCIKVRVGTLKDGTERIEIQHWRNCHPVTSPDTTTGADTNSTHS